MADQSRESFRQEETFAPRIPRVLAVLAQLGVAESYEMKHLRDAVRDCQDLSSALLLVEEYQYFAGEMLARLEGRDISLQLSNFCLSALHATVLAEALHIRDADNEYFVQVAEARQAAAIVLNPVAREVLDLF